MDWSKVGEYIVGSLPAVGAVAALLLRIDRRLNLFMIEHEMLMQKYAKDTGIKLHELPTRTRGVK